MEFFAQVTENYLDLWLAPEQMCITNRCHALQKVQGIKYVSAWHLV